MSPFLVALLLGGALVALSALFWWQHTVNVSEAHQMVRQGARLVDVDTAECFAQGHLDGAVHVPADEIARRCEEIGPPTRAIVVYARTSAPSRRAANVLRGIGYQEVRSLGPMKRWVEAGAPAPRATAGEWFRHTFQRARPRTEPPADPPIDR